MPTVRPTNALTRPHAGVPASRALAGGLANLYWWYWSS
jgi:hypothetical protein